MKYQLLPKKTLWRESCFLSRILCRGTVLLILVDTLSPAHLMEISYQGKLPKVNPLLSYLHYYGVQGRAPQARPVVGPC